MVKLQQAAIQQAPAFYKIFLLGHLFNSTERENQIEYAYQNAGYYHCAAKIGRCTLNSFERKSTHNITPPNLAET
ncbi:hypothetical protein SAMN05421798_11143 [Pseudovibrio axinellae]|nr:hypothetical protein SAMN05421798_11143 [Pseudovibrio axinellae]